MFGVSRLSLREATKALEFLGIIESRTGVGLTVGRIDLERVTDHLGFHPALHDVEPQQLIASRIVVEVGVLPHVVRRMAEDDSIRESLQSIVDRSASAKRLQDWIDLDIQFHRVLIEASGLQPLVAFSDLLQVFFQRFRDSIKKAEWRDGIASHKVLIDALSTGHLARAESELREHIESHLTRV
jgi:GntR family transcriptional repressor for pyruvate dehydrogenase complex